VRLTLYLEKDLVLLAAATAADAATAATAHRGRRCREERVLRHHHHDIRRLDVVVIGRLGEIERHAIELENELLWIKALLCGTKVRQCLAERLVLQYHKHRREREREREREQKHDA